jgi:lysophospholipid acyltransferase (LPLAT)-like uncharacterized protein
MTHRPDGRQPAPESPGQAAGRRGTFGTLRQGVKYAAAGALGGVLLDALLGTTRIEALNTEAYEVHERAGRPVVFALWHGRLLPPTYRHRHKRIVTLASQSGDGEYITRILHHWGFHVVRGSSSRGGDTALRELIRLVRGGRSVAVTPDGPRGPREKLKPGVLQIAQLTGAPLVPVASAASRAWWFESWDRFLIPKPFARVRIMYGDAFLIPRRADTAELASLAERIEARIAALTQLVEAPFS